MMFHVNTHVISKLEYSISYSPPPEMENLFIEKHPSQVADGKDP